jgi:hypothetical protein
MHEDSPVSDYPLKARSYRVDFIDSPSLSLCPLRVSSSLSTITGARVAPSIPQNGTEPPPQLASLAPAPVLPQGGSVLRRRLGAPSNATWYHFAPAARFAGIRLRNFCLSAKDQAFSPHTTVFQGNPIPILMKCLGLSVK